jgi:hypothetical protein
LMSWKVSSSARSRNRHTSPAYVCRVCTLDL